MSAILLSFTVVSGAACVIPRYQGEMIKLALDFPAKRYFIDAWGDGYIAGIIKELPKDAPPGSEYPVWRKVRLHREVDGLPIAETWSDKGTGAYRFDNVPEQWIYTVISYDHTGIFQGVIADREVPKRYTA